MYSALKKYSLLSVLVLLAFPVKAIITEEPTLEQTGGIYCPYPEVDIAEIPVPAGLEPVYVSHYGRHGSRWITEDARYERVVNYIDSLGNLGRLTPKGMELRQQLHLVWDDAQGRSGCLTPLGERQHRGIAERMYARMPILLGDTATVRAVASTAGRCIFSMMAFTDKLKELNPALHVTKNAYPRNMSFIAYTPKELESYAKWMRTSWVDEFLAFCNEKIQLQRLMDSLVTDSEELPIEEKAALAEGLYWIAVDLPNTELDLRLWDYFTFEELKGFWQTINARMFGCNLFSDLNENLMPTAAASLLSKIIEDADASLSGENNVSADLRFGHDTNLIRLLALMGIEECAATTADLESVASVWRDYKVSPMAANLQIVFYRAAGNGEPMVQLLLNERPTSIPALGASDENGLYPWNALREFWKHRCLFGNSRGARR